MTFEETLAQVVEVLRRERRVSYRALRRRFSLDEEYLEDLKVEIIQAKQLATDEDNTILVWTGDAAPTSVSAPECPPLAYTPAHLSEKILTSRTALEGERKPATVQAMLAARIDRLPPEDKRLLQTAAVIGTEVPWRLLQAIADTSEEALYRRLAWLQAAEFLYETSLFSERAYTFKHALTHEVAYGGPLQEQRRFLHARLVAALETLAGDRVDDQVERLAQHALRGEVWDKALAQAR